MMKDPSYCYKFYWLEALVKLISEGVTETTFGDVIDEMICNAWYSVREYHIHLSGLQANGDVGDGLERAVNELSKHSGLESNASKVQIMNAIKEHAAVIRKYKVQLTNMVPYKALNSFFPNGGEVPDSKQIRRITAYIKRFNSEVELLPYTLGESATLKKEVFLDPTWIEMIRDNTVPILGWIQHEKVKWLQNNNPEVPGIVYKLTPMDEKTRKLDKVRDLWNGILELHEVKDVFTDNPVDLKKYEVDHFIPRSFVMNDELWNLSPMDSSLNSSKNKQLPKWDPFFSRFAANQYLMYSLMCERPGIHKLFVACYRDNLHSIWAGQELYKTGNTKNKFYSILKKNMRPVYESARRQGYAIWNEKMAIKNKTE